MKNPKDMTLGEIENLFSVHGISPFAVLQEVLRLVIHCQKLDAEYKIEEAKKKVENRRAEQPPRRARVYEDYNAECIVIGEL
jgi:hypothetical protein